MIVCQLLFMLVMSIFAPSAGAVTDMRSLYYFDDASLLEMSSKGSPLVFISTGWSGSAIGKAYKAKNRVKSSRGMAIAYSLAIRMHRLGIKGKVMYLTTQRPNEAQRRYLFRLHGMESRDEHASGLVRMDLGDTPQKREQEFRAFEEQYFEEFRFSTDNLIENLGPQDKRRYFYLFEGKNYELKLKLKNRIDRLKAEGAYFAGMEYHFGGPFFQDLKTVLGLPNMPLLGSEIYDQLGDDDPDGVDDAAQNQQVMATSEWDPIMSAASLGTHCPLCNDIPKDLGTKGQCRRLYRDLGVPHARGSYLPTREVDKLTYKLYFFLRKNRDVTDVVVKLERSSAGDGNKTYHLRPLFERNPTFFTDMWHGVAVLQAELNTQYTEAYVRRIHDHGAVFEAFISGKNFKSPAVLGMIMPDKVEVYFDYNQELGGVDGQCYTGSLGPASNQHMPDFGSDGNIIAEADLRTPSLQVLEGLRQCGARGAVGIDFVTCEEPNAQGGVERKCYAIENNVRHTGTMYPHRSLFFLTGRETMENRYFASTNAVKVGQLPAGHSNEVRSWFYSRFMKDAEHRYNPVTKTGCIIYMDLWEMHELGVACIGRTKQELSESFDGFKEEITKGVSAYIKQEFSR